jgi:competence protein ComEA
VNAKSSAARLVFILTAASLLFSFAALANAQKKSPANPVDLNSASVAELQQVPGIGPATAKSIVKFREKSGPFKRVEDLLAIRGISKRALERMRPYLTVVPPRPATNPPPNPR